MKRERDNPSYFRRKPELVTARRLEEFQSVRNRPMHRPVEIDEYGEFVIAQPGEWITCDADGRESVWSDEEFKRRFDAAE